MSNATDFGLVTVPLEKSIILIKLMIKVIIGDEILKGKIQEENSAYATKKFWEKGIPCKRIAVVQDNVPDIVNEVRYQVVNVQRMKAIGLNTSLVEFF